MNESRSTSSGWGVAVAIAVALALAYMLRYVLLPFVAAGALAYVARPLITLLRQRAGMPRPAAAMVAFLLLMAILAGLAYGAESILAPQLGDMLNNSQRMVEGLLDHIFQQFNLRNTVLFGQRLDARDAAGKFVDVIKQAAGANLLVAIGGGIGALMGAVMTLVLFAFIVFTGPQLAAGSLWLVPPHLRSRARLLALEIDPMIGSYLRGMFIIVLFTASVTYIVTGPIFHVQHAVFLALAVGLLELVPVVGPILSFVTFGLVAVQQTSMGTILGFGAFTIALRLTIDQLVGPLVLGRAARIPAIVVIFSFLAGGAIYGMLGVILAIPVAATIKIVLTDLYEGPPAPAGARSTED